MKGVSVMSSSARAISLAPQMSSPSLGSLSGALVRGSGSLSDGSAKTADSASSLISGVQDIAAQNSQLSSLQAEKLNAWQEAQNQKAMAFNAAEAAKNRDWQKMMSDTAHQREVADLKAAGLNPVLSAMGGQGASVGSGATASGVTSSGSKGEVDQSASSGLVSLLGTLMNTQTQLLSQSMSARSNEAIADKTNAMNQLIAQMTGDYSLARQRLSNQSAMDVQKSREAHDIYMAQNYPSNLLGVVEAVLSAFSGGQGPGETLSSGAKSVYKSFSDLMSGKSVPISGADNKTSKWLNDVKSSLRKKILGW